MAMVCMVTVFYHFIFFKSDESINILYCVLRYHSAFFNYNDFYKILYLIFDYPHKHYTFKYFEV